MMFDSTDCTIARSAFARPDCSESSCWMDAAAGSSADRCSVDWSGTHSVAADWPGRHSVAAVGLPGRRSVVAAADSRTGRLF